MTQFLCCRILKNWVLSNESDFSKGNEMEQQQKRIFIVKVTLTKNWTQEVSQKFPASQFSVRQLFDHS
jgi:hypothetical protein